MASAIGELTDPPKKSILVFADSRFEHCDSQSLGVEPSVEHGSQYKPAQLLAIAFRAATIDSFSIQF